MGLSVFFLWMTNSIIGLTFPSLLSAIGLSATFFIFVALGIWGIFFIYKYMPEAKDRTLEELEHYFHNLEEEKKQKDIAVREIK